MVEPSDKAGDLAITRTSSEVVIRVGLMLVLVYWCFTIAEPFLVPIVWGMIIAVAVHPGFDLLRRRLGERGGLAAWIVTLLLLVLLIVPLTVLSRALIENGAGLARSLSGDGLTIPEPPPYVADWPVIGKPIDLLWRQTLSNIGAALTQIAPHSAGHRRAGCWPSSPGRASAWSASWWRSSSPACCWPTTAPSARFADAVATRLVGDRGRDLVDLAERTVRSVARGIIGTALIQTTLVGAGLFAAGVPGAAFLTLICFLLCVVQIGPSLVLVGAAIWVFGEDDTLTFALFVAWGDRRRLQRQFPAALPDEPRRRHSRWR